MVVNEYLVEDLKKLGLWNADMLEKIKYHDGSVQAITEIPLAIREKYKEVFEIEPQWLIKAAAYRGRWIDMSQSLNIFYSGTSGKVLSDIYQYAWNLGLKTTYYLRTMGASRTEKSTVNMAKFGGTSKTDTAVGHGTAGAVPSAVIIEETVTVASTMGSVPSPIIMSQNAQGVQEMVYAQATVATAIAPQMRAEAPKVQEPPKVSSGIPSFGQEPITAPANRPKIEILGETCESCSA
jgi:ribonucleotide reductase alpha subunit